MKNYSYILSGACLTTASLLLFNCSGLTGAIVSNHISSDFGTILAEDMVLTSPTARLQTAKRTRTS